ncbi:uncharacterized protein F4822DRAFT_386324 [Hypoxylon trugodes]|uniref:uncharacterized protein n=1 Tax=Hypoxylon trugodes TaxID=326681 RepID=UPI0021952115|nr:uncharacterized protein F4822DRAFT_386324 [Hypoxylon trugodes]KAI1393899.1 hypothetical protein F4822DRAFT_386324 [Hypoxylon trugodes]
MAPTTPSQSPEPKSGSLTSSNTFPRNRTPESNGPKSRTQRASTIENGAAPRVSIIQETPPQQTRQKEKPDTFESETNDDVIEAPRASVDMDEIPIELVSKTDNFIDSLSAKVHPAPPNIENLSKLFQDFYHVAASHIKTHIDSLATRQTREASPTPSSYSRASAASLLRAKAASFSNKEKTKATPTKEEQQMLTADEYANRKKARKALEQKRVLLEEAVERRLCEGIYDRIYRHRTTQDEAQDDKLRSKTAALALVGIGPADLGVDLGDSEDTPEARANRQEEIRGYLEQARKDLYNMHEKRYPLGKLNHLKAAHKSIVDTLSHFHPSSSADEIMPMLIYTLITMPPEKLNVISDSNFIQRFRWEEKLEGEAAYCLTNLEAVITFLQTVDLASLRADEASSGPVKLETQTEMPKAETFPPAYTAGLSAPASNSTTATPENVQPVKHTQSAASLRAAVQRRRLSDLIQTPAQAIGTASDSIFSTADQGFKTIGTSLGDSYKFLLGKLRDSSASGRELVVPRTLDEARKLIGTPPPEDDASIDGSLVQGGDNTEHSTAAKEDKLLSLVGGKGVARDRSADSTRSGRSASSSKKAENKENPTTPAATPSPSSSNPALVESMRNLGNSLNPMNRFSGMSMMRGFGRAATIPTPTPPAKDAAVKTADGGDLATAFPDIAAALPPKDIPKIDPPKKKFMELQNPADLRIGDVLELLRDYRRLAGALKDMDAFKE